MKLERTPLHNWIASRTGIAKTEILNNASLEEYQLAMLIKTLDHAKKNSPFYQLHLRNTNIDDIKSIQDIDRLPFTFPQDIACKGLDMLCVSHSEIARIVTLQTSGTTAFPKRIYFTHDDLELTADFFAQGMKAIVKPGQNVMVLMPGPNLGSAGERLAKGLARIKCQTFVHGFVQDPEQTIKQINNLKIDCLIGLPVQVLALARWPGTPANGRIKSVLLSGDYLPCSLVQAIKDQWHCPVFNHYGLTETGLGGGVECQALDGCHLREADLFVEIVDNQGRRVPDGRYGEIVITTLTRKGMPLIRYRTGDISRFMTSPCSCGSNLRRLDRLKGRSLSKIQGRELGLEMIDEAVFQYHEIVDFKVSIDQKKRKTVLNLEFWPGADPGPGLDLALRQQVCKIPVIEQLVKQNLLIVNNIFVSCKKLFPFQGKRTIERK